LPGFDYQTRAGKPERWTIWSYRVNDRPLFEQAFVELREAADKPYIDSHATDLVDQSLISLSSPQTLGEIVWRREHLTVNSLPTQRFYAIWPALSHAAELAQHGQVKQANQLIRDCRRIARSIAQRSQLVGDLMTARGMYMLTLGMEAFIDQEAGDTAGFNHALAAINEEQAFSDQLWRKRQAAWNARQSSDVISIADRGFSTMDATENVDFAPGRRAEYAVADRLALSMILLILTSLAAVAGVSAAIVRVRSGRWPTLAFVGWRRLAGVVLISSLVPVGAYAIYALSPLSARHRAADNSVERLAIEYATVACAIAALLRILSNRALRKRAAELGADELKRRQPGKSILIMSAALALGVATFLALTRNGALPWRGQWLFPLLAAGLIGYLLIWLFGNRSEPAGALQKPTRRISPPIAWVVIVSLLLAAGWVLFSPPFSRDFEGIIRTTAMTIVAILTLSLLVRGVMELRRGAAAGSDRTFDYRLSVALPILCSALVLSLVAGLPLKLEERRAVAAMNATGQAHGLSHELDQYLWRTLKEHMQRAPE
jgi:hypothetical protein